MPIVVEDVREGIRITPRGEFDRTIIAVFTVDDLGPFTVEMSKAEWTQEAMEKAISSEAEKVRALKAMG